MLPKAASFARFNQFLCFVVIAGISVPGLAQSLVDFSTRILGPSAQVRDVDGTLLSGTNCFAQLYSAYGLGQPIESLVPIGVPANFQRGVGAGYVNTGTINSLGMVVPTFINAYDGPEIAGPATVQMRAWSGPFPTYGAALAGSGQYGSSLPFNMPSTGVTEGNLMIGLQGFSLVPEPPAWSLGLLGIVALWGARRWRKARIAWKA